MYMKLTVFDVAQQERGRARLQLDWQNKKWSIAQDTQQVWQRVGYSRQGSFEVKHWSVIWLWDQGHNTVIFHNAPLFHFDLRHVHSPGEARIFDSRDKTFKEGKIRWTIETLSPLRKKALQHLEQITPAPYGSSKWKKNPYHALQPGPIPNYTNCIEFPAYLGYLLGDSKFPLAYSVQKAKGWTKYDSAKQPLPGDVFILCKTAKRDHSTAHIGIIYSTNWNNSQGRIWRTADWGQGNSSWDGDWVERTYNPQAGTLTDGPKRPNKPPRAIKGWLDLDDYFGKRQVI